MTVSGTCPRNWGDVNHSWNWVNGSDERSERRRLESENCAALEGVVVGAAESGGASPGATEKENVRSGGCWMEESIISCQVVRGPTPMATAVQGTKQSGVRHEI